MKRGGWILHWLLGLAGLGFLLASFQVVPPFIFELDQWALSSCLKIGYIGLFLGNLTITPEDLAREKMFFRKRVLLSLLSGVIGAVACLLVWPFLEFSNPAPLWSAAVTTGGFALLTFFIGALGFPLPVPSVLAVRNRLTKE